MDFTLPSFKIDFRDFFKGANSYDDYPNGEFLDSVLGMNPFAKPGTLAISPTIPTAGINNILFDDGVIAYTFAGNATSFFTVSSTQKVGNVGNGYLTYMFNTGFLQTTPPATTDVVASVGTGRYYRMGYTDSQYYLNKVYTTCGTDISRFDIATAGFTANWWTTTNDTRTGAHATALDPLRRHMETVFENILYVADGHYLHKVDNGVITTRVLDVPTDYVIQEVVNYSGLIYIFADNSQGINIGTNINSKIFTWDGLSDSWIDEWELNNQVTTAYVFKGSLYIWTTGYMGIWNNGAIEILRPLGSAVYSYPVFKSMITPTSDSLLWVEATDIIRMAKPFIKAASYSFYRYLRAPITNTKFAGIMSFKKNDLLVTDAGQVAGYSSPYYIPDINTASTTDNRVATLNDRDFNMPVKIRGVRIKTLPLASGNILKAGFVNDFGETVYPSYKSGKFQQADTRQANRTIWTFNFHNAKALQSMNPLFDITGNVYIKSIEYFYESSENKSNE